MNIIAAFLEIIQGLLLIGIDNPSEKNKKQSKIVVLCKYLLFILIVLIATMILFAILNAIRHLLTLIF